MIARLKKFLATPTGKEWTHIGLTFAATSAVTMYFNGQHVLAEHGLDGLKAQAPAVAAAALVAAWHVVKPSVKLAAAKLLH